MPRQPALPARRCGTRPGWRCGCSPAPSPPSPVCQQLQAQQRWGVEAQRDGLVAVQAAGGLPAAVPVNILLHARVVGVRLAALGRGRLDHAAAGDEIKLVGREFQRQADAVFALRWRNWSYAPRRRSSKTGRPASVFGAVQLIEGGHQAARPPARQHLKRQQVQLAQRTRRQDGIDGVRYPATASVYCRCCIYGRLPAFLLDASLSASFPLAMREMPLSCAQIDECVKFKDTGSISPFLSPQNGDKIAEIHYRAAPLGRGLPSAAAALPCGGND